MKTKDVRIKKGKIVFKKRIADLAIGESGYAVPWACDPRTNELDLSFTIDKEPGRKDIKITKSYNCFVIEIPDNYEYI